MGNTDKIIGPISEFVDKMSKSWDLTLVYPKIWALSFGTSKGSHITSSIYKVLSEYNDVRRFQDFINSANNIYRQFETDESIKIKNGVTDHFMLATKLTLPDVQTTVSTGYLPSNNSGGNIGGRVVNRTITDATRTLKITFLETNKSVIDYLIHPWIIALGHRGLKFSSDLPDLRINIDAYLFAKSGPSNYVYLSNENVAGGHEAQYYKRNTGLDAKPFEWVQSSDTINKLSYNSTSAPFCRKKVTFHNCYPIAIGGKSYNYSPTIDNNEIMSEVTFAFDYCSFDKEKLSITTDPRIVTEGKHNTITPEGELITSTHNSTV